MNHAQTHFLLILCIILGLCCSVIPQVFALISIPTTTNFGFGNGSYLSFSSIAYCASYSQVDGYLDFVDLSLNGVNGELYITSTTNITVSSIRSGSSWFNYTVAGASSQTFYRTDPLVVYIDGVLQPLDSGWTCTGEYVTITGATASVWMSPFEIEEEEPPPAGTPSLYGSGFSVYIAEHQLLGFQNVPITFFVYLNATSGNLNGSDCSVTLYTDGQGTFTFTALEVCSLHMYSVGGTPILKKNNIAFSGVTSVSASETMTLSWTFQAPELHYLITVNNGVYGTASPLGTVELAYGAHLTLTATPMNSSYAFSYWQTNTGSRIATNPYILTVTRTQTFTPVFTRIYVPPTTGGGGYIGSLLALFLPMTLLIGIAGFVIVLAKNRRND